MHIVPDRELMAQSAGSVPKAIPPHPPLISGGWYHGMSVEEVVGPGRYPVGASGDRSVGVALVLTLLFGPLGLYYVSHVGAAICTGLTAFALVLYGPAPLAIAWPLTMVCAAIIASGLHREHQ